jgi:RNA polymerase sigma-54 factor
VYQVTESLQDHLLWQLNLTPFSLRDKQIAEAFIDSIENSGFINENLADILSHHEANTSDDPIDDDELLAVLHRLQQFDPPGVLARNVQECLLIQLHQLSVDTPFVAQATRLTSDFLTDIASMDLISLSKKTHYEVGELRGAIKLIQGLNPRPGESLAANNTEYIAPDAYVEKVAGRWQVRLNDSNMPRLKINEVYSSLIKRSDNSEQNQYLKDNLAEARWFLRSLESRNETLMRVAITVVELQQGFLDHGPIGMKPMVLADIATKLELHESTISRVTTAKYLATPQGIFELKYFFSSHVGTSSGGECSSTAVCAILKTLIEAERPSKPLSDNKLMALLEQQGIQVARRTVAKYRESLGIPSSSQRKRFENAN